MRRPDPVWECEYKITRRKHRHRCFCCRRILEPGEKVLMGWVTGGSRACHIEHADNLYAPEQGSETVREIMTIWGLRALKNRGWKVKELETHR